MFCDNFGQCNLVHIKEVEEDNQNKTEVRNYINRAREMAQWLRALTAVPEVLGSIPSNYMVAHNPL